MRPVPQIISLLRADPSVSDLINQRVYADNPPQDDDLPFVVLTIENTNARAALDNCQIKLYAARMKVDIVCSSRSLAEEVQEKIEDALVGYTSSDSTHPIQGVVVDSGVSWELLVPTDGSDERGYWCSQDYFINYARA
jgi:hypothetical protein